MKTPSRLLRDFFVDFAGRFSIGENAITSLRNQLIDTYAIDDKKLDASLRKKLTHSYTREKSKLKKTLTAVQVDAMTKKFRKQLEKRIKESASLIKLNRTIQVAETMKAVNFWVSQPVDQRTNANETMQKIGLSSYEYNARRVRIDQNHKLVANIAAIAAEESDALGARWHTMEDDRTRKSHKKLDRKIFAFEWARKKYPELEGFTAIESLDFQPAEPVNCRCEFEYLYRISDFT